MPSRRWLAAILLAMPSLRAMAGWNPGTVTGRLEVAGDTRTWVLYRPHIVPPPGAVLPLVIALHGGGGTGAGMATFTRDGFNRLADRDGFFVVYPDGKKFFLRKRGWNDGRNVDSIPAQQHRVDDVGFIRALIDRLTTDYPIDPKRIYVTGASNGGFMTNRLGCELADRIAAIAPVMGSMGTEFQTTCAPSRPVPALIINGTEDPLVPFRGGEVTVLGTHRGKALAVPAVARFWAGHDGCPAEPGQREALPDTDPTDGTRAYRETWGPGRENSEVILITVEGGGHTWPGGTQYLPVRMVGRVSRDFSACEVIWEFFKRHPMP